MKRNRGMDVYAVVEENEEPQFAFNLNMHEVDDLGDYGIEQMVRNWCKRQGYTFVDYAT